MKDPLQGNQLSVGTVRKASVRINHQSNSCLASETVYAFTSGILYSCLITSCTSLYLGVDASVAEVATSSMGSVT